MNDAPTDGDEAHAVIEDTPLIVSASSADGLLHNTVDIDGATPTILSYKIAGINGTQAVGSDVVIAGVGTLKINSDGSYVFTPVANYTGLIPVVTYTMTDGTATDISTLTLTMTPVNDPPVDGNEAHKVILNTTLAVSATDSGGLLRNATDVEGDTLTITGYTIPGVTGTQAVGTPVTIPGVGTITINSDGAYSFTPAANYTGAIPVITYTVSDGVDTDTSTLTLTMDPVVSIAATDPTAVEGTPNSTLVFTVTQSKPSTLDTSIIVTLNLGAVEAADIESVVTYVDAAGQPATTTVAALIQGLALTIPATPDGSAPWSPVFTITATQDNIYEVSEALTMNLALAQGETDATLGTDTATGTIYDEDSTTRSQIDPAVGNEQGDKPVVSIAATDPTAVEGTPNSTLVFTVTQSNISTLDTTVLVKGTLNAIVVGDIASISYTDASGSVVNLTTTAQITSFFTTGVTVKIPAGSMTAPVITFTAVTDTTLELSESFSVGISRPVNATLGTPSATGTIYDIFTDNDESVTTPEDTPILANVIDTALASIPGVSLTSFTVTGVLGTFNAGQTATISGVGTITIAANGAYTFTPVANWSGVVPTITYTLTDGGSNEQSDLLITVIPVNDPPVAVDDRYTMLVDGGVVTLTPLTLAADSDPDGDTLSVTSINGTTLTPGAAQIITVTNGTVNVAANGTMTFTPDAGFTGTVTFPYVISDSHGGTATANEFITVKPVDAQRVYNHVPTPPPPVQQNRVSENKPAPVTHHNNERFIEKRPLELGQYEFHTVVLNFNGQFGGINQFSPPTVESTLTRDDLEYSNHTPYYQFDRVGDEVRNAQRSIDAKLADTNKAAFASRGLKSESDVVARALGNQVPQAAKFGQPETWAKANLNAIKTSKDSSSNNESATTNRLTLADNMKVSDKDSQAGSKNHHSPTKKIGFVGKSSLANQIQTVMNFKTR